MDKTLQEVLDHLLEHRWLYEIPVIQILVDKTLDRFPIGWLQALETLSTCQLNDLVTGKYFNSNWPSDLREFILKCRKFKEKLSKEPFSLSADIKSQFSNLPQNLTVGLSYKKQQEAFYLAQLTHEMCLKEGLSVIVDLGAGLGYVCQILNHLFSYKVLGLESNPSIAKGAIERQETLYPFSKSSLRYSCLTVTENSSDEIENLLQSLTNTESVTFCLIGLHSCGDLSINALKLFKNMTNAKLLIMMSCCYHKIEVCDRGFKNFPLSEELKCKFDDVGDVFQRPFLRLACQEPSERWENMTEEEHQRHSLCTIGRAVLQLFSHENKFSLSKTKRKSTRSSQCSNFNSYFKGFILRYDFNGAPLNETKYQQQIHDLWSENRSNLHTSEIYTGLQLVLQASAEYLVLKDRVHWLEEQNFHNTRIMSVLDKNLSPRSYAIVSKK